MRKEKQLYELISKHEYAAYYFRLDVGSYELHDLKEIVSLMFRVLNRANLSKIFINKKICKGMVRRFFVQYDNQLGLYIPYFSCIWIGKKMNDYEEYNYKFLIYLSWLTSCISTFKKCIPIGYDWELIQSSNLSIYLEKYFEASLYSDVSENIRSIIEDDIHNYKVIEILGTLRQRSALKNIVSRW